MPSTDALIRENRQKYEIAVEAINTNEDWNEQAKQRMIEELYQAARGEHSKLAQKVQADAWAGVERARSEAFAAPRVSNADPALVAMSYRQALAQVKETIEPRVLEETLEQATLVGDEVLAKAVLVRGYQLEHEGLVGSYLRGRPEERKRYDKFTAAAEEYNDLEAKTWLFGQPGTPAPPEEMRA